MDIPTSKILDVHWRLGVTAASSGSGEVGTAFLQLKLLVNECGKSKTIFVEMTLAQFYKFLNDLEKAESNLEILL